MRNVEGGLGKEEGRRRRMADSEGRVKNDQGRRTNEEWTRNNAEGRRKNNAEGSLKIEE